MNYVFVGKKNTVSDALKVRAEEKLSRLDRIIPEDASATVTFGVVHDIQKIEVSVALRKRTIRAEATDRDMYAAIDKVVDILEGQIVKYKARLKHKSKGNRQYYDEYVESFDANIEEVEEMEDGVVVRTKTFGLKPMTVEEAILELELLHHDFFVFIDGHADEVSVVYRRKDDSYGVLKPER